jgi:Superinfection immunity protein
MLRGHYNLLSIFALNLVLGFTVVGWGIALVWACWNTKPPDNRHFYYHDGPRG